jgi:enoyl-CoA hydratase/carnithine racemase
VIGEVPVFVGMLPDSRTCLTAWSTGWSCGSEDGANLGRGRPITAQRAYEIGLVNPLAEPAELMDTALELAGEVLAGAPLSVQAARETVMLSTEMGRSGALKAARHASEYCYTSEDAQDGPRAFAEKRAPRWRGR